MNAELDALFQQMSQEVSLPKAAVEEFTPELKENKPDEALCIPVVTEAPMGLPPAPREPARGTKEVAVNPEFAAAITDADAVTAPEGGIFASNTKEGSAYLLDGVKAVRDGLDRTGKRYGFMKEGNTKRTFVPGDHVLYFLQAPAPRAEERVHYIPPETPAPAKTQSIKEETTVTREMTATPQGQAPALIQNEELYALLKDVDPEIAAEYQALQRRERADEGRAVFPQYKIEMKPMFIMDAATGQQVKCRVFTNPEGLPVKSLKGIIIYDRANKAYFEGPYVKGKKEAPACYSDDGVHSYGGKRLARLCQNCEMAEFGTARQGKGPACATKTMLYIFRPDKKDIITVNGTHLNSQKFKEYRAALEEKSLSLQSVMTEITLTGDKPSDEESSTSVMVCKPMAANIEDIVASLKAFKDNKHKIVPSEPPEMPSEKKVSPERAQAPEPSLPGAGQSQAVLDI